MKAIICIKLNLTPPPIAIGIGIHPCPTTYTAWNLDQNNHCAMDMLRSKLYFSRALCYSINYTLGRVCEVFTHAILLLIIGEDMLSPWLHTVYFIVMPETTTMWVNIAFNQYIASWVTHAEAKTDGVALATEYSLVMRWVVWWMWPFGIVQLGDCSVVCCCGWF